MSENNISCLFGMLIKYGTTSTKTLAKIASKLAKRCPRLDGCCCKQDIEKVLTIFLLRDIWGIGCRYGRMFDGMDIRTALQFVQLSREWVHARMGVTGLRMWNELQGVECIAFEQMPPQKQQITISRSFLREICEQEPLERIVAEFASMCAEKLRGQRSVCCEVRSYIYTDRHRDDRLQRYETGFVTLPEPFCMNRAHLSRRYTTD